MQFIINLNKILQLAIKSQISFILNYNYTYKKIEVIPIKNKEISVNGKIEVTYKLLCKNDVNKEINIADLLANEKIAKLIKNELLIR